VSSGQQAVATAERFAAGQASQPELYHAYKVQNKVRSSLTDSSNWALEEAVLTALFVASPHYSGTMRAAVHSVRALTHASGHPEEILQQENAFQIAALRDLFGDLFYSGSLQPDEFLVNDRTVRALAQSIEEERTFEQLPILADALEDAGCTDSMILEHCRGNGTHLRGCWVIDWLLRGSEPH
jgi:hypothetical protein